tara:strand:- start:2712 stop:6926 length:4215 start_codon:yes stop_codon:yes gene_type:complete
MKTMDDILIDYPEYLDDVIKFENKNTLIEQIIVDKSIVKVVTDKKLPESYMDNMNIQNINTFVDLYHFLIHCPDEDIFSWIQDSWVGKDKQESLLRLFSALGLINKLNNYHFCSGNFNLKTIQKISTLNEFFYYRNKPIFLKDKGDSSDLTCLSKNNNKHLLVSTSKNLNKNNVGKLDIDKILTNFEQYKNDGYTMSLCICIRNIDDFNTMNDNIESTNHSLKSIINSDDTIIIDWNDLNQAYKQFKYIYASQEFNDILSFNNNPLVLKMHQVLSVHKTIQLKKDGKSSVLWGHIQRSGKSYIIAGAIIEDSCGLDNCNYLVLTTAPRETIDQYVDVFNHSQFYDFNIIVLNGNNKKPIIKNKNIIICSKQFLQSKINKGSNKGYEKPKNIGWLKKISFDMRFIDESHNGGTTELAQKTLEYYGNDSFTVQITATYSKPIHDFDIPKDCWILWDLEDVKLCKNLKDKNIKKLSKKHGNDIINIIDMYSHESIINEYSKYPELWILTHEIKPDVVEQILEETTDNDFGWSTDACFNLKQSAHKGNVIYKDEFENEQENLKLWYTIFGKKSNIGIPDKDYPLDTVFINRIKDICNNQDSRFIGQGDFSNEPMIIMAFLPQINIDLISTATFNLLTNHNIIPDFDIICINSKQTNDSKKSIEDARKSARISGKKGVLVLSGKQCGLGVSIHNCDIVLLLNNSMGFDMIYQMMFRCMTEGKNKKCGFVVDLNIKRVVETSIINYATIIKPNKHPRKACKYLFKERIINLNGDHWIPSFGNSKFNISLSSLSKTVYDIYSSNIETLNLWLNRLKFKEVNLSQDEQLLFNTIFTVSKPTKKQKEIIDKIIDELENDDFNDINDGLEKVKVDSDNNDDNNSDNDNNDNDSKDINYMDILRHIIPLVCLLTIHDEETSFIEMFNIIENDKLIFDILIDQTKSWWGKDVDIRIIERFIHIYIKYIKDDKETSQIIRTIKELFKKNIDNSVKLSELVDKYFEASDLEKSENAEITTVKDLRTKSIDKIPCEFWTKPRKIIEPCSGKGGYIVDIIGKFMEGLKPTIPDKDIRYKTIVEECIYFCDINSTNLFICKLLIDPYNQYKLNYHQGNTLELDILDKWNINGFDLHVCNPPYEDMESNTGKRKPANHNLWSKFLNWSYDNLNDNGLLLYITPTSWMSPTSKNKHIFYENHILYLNVNECKRYFNVGSTFSFYVIKKTKDIGLTEVECEYNKTVYYDICDLSGMNYLPNFITNNTINIIKKFMNNDLPKISFARMTKYHTSTKKHLFGKKSDVFKYDYKNTKTNPKYCKEEHPLQYTSKILMNLSGNLNPYYDKGEYGFTESQMYLITDQESYIDIINSKLYTFVFSVCKWSGFNNEKVYHNIPFITDTYSDSDLYKLFDLTSDEIKLIEKS